MLPAALEAHLRPVMSRCIWPLRTGLACTIASLLHLLCGYYPDQTQMVFALPCFAPVMTTIVCSSSLGGTYRSAYLLVTGVTLGALLSTLALLIVGRSTGGIMGAFVVLVFIFVLPDSAHPRSLPMDAHLRPLLLSPDLADACSLRDHAATL